MKLPDIQYNPNVRPLAKEDTSLPLKKAQAAIALSKARLGAELDVAAADHKANVQMSRARLAADQDRIQSEANIAIDAFKIKSNRKMTKQLVTAQVASSLAQTALSQGSRWYAAQEEAKVAQGITTYNSQVRNLAAELESQQTIDLNKYQDVDFSSIPANMIYEGVDSVTGQKIRTAPNYLAAPLVYASREAAIRQAAGADIQAEYSRAQFDNGIAPTKGAVDAGMVKATFNNQRQFLAAQYEQSLKASIQQEDLHTSLGIIDSAEARGVWSFDYAAEKRGSLIGDIKFSSLVRQADQATTTEQLKLIKEAAYELPKSEQISVRSVVAAREHALDKAADERKVIADRVKLATNTETAMDIGIGAGGMKSFEDGREAIVKWATKNDPEHLSDYTSAWRTRFNQAHNAEQAEVRKITDKAYEDIAKDPTTPIPAKVTGTDYANMQKLKDMGMQGIPRVTDAKRWNEIFDKMVKDPQAFKTIDLGPEMTKLDEQDFRFFKQAQAKMLTPDWNQTQVESASSQFDNFADQAFGPMWKNNKGTVEDANALRQAYISAVDQFEKANDRKSTASDRQGILTDIFQAKVQTFSKGWFSDFRPETSTILKSDAKPYISRISVMLIRNGKQVNAENIAAAYNYLLKNNLLDELGE